MVMYAFVDPNVGDIMLGNVPPDDVGYWWPVPFGARVNDLFVNREGHIDVLPPRPSMEHEFNVHTEQWFDPRSQQQLAADLEYRRSLESMSKVDFLASVMSLGHLTPQLAVASRLEPPPFLASYLEGLPPENVAVETLRWADATTLYRSDIILMESLRSIGFTDESLDQLFKGQ